jgi:cytochrome c-type biogenesis protein CcmH
VTLAAVLIAMAVVAIALVAVPMIRDRRPPPSRAAHEMEIYRDQLDEVDRDLARNLISPDQAEGAKAEIARRILALDKTEEPREDGSRIRQSALVAVAAAVAVPAFAAFVYLAQGSPGLLGRPAVEAQQAAANAPASADNAALRRRVADLARGLEADPSKLGDWVALGEALTGLREHARAAVAYRQAARLAPDDAELASRAAEAHAMGANGQVTPEARELFEEALRRNPAEPRARYYLGLADRQAGRLREALDRWLALEAASPPDAPWLRFLRPRIADLARETGIDADALKGLREKAQSDAPPAPAGGAAPGPTREQVEAAQTMSAEDRAAMIRSMVDRLAARLDENPGDPDGWVRLARARAVLGDRTAAKEAWAKAAALRPNDVSVLGGWADSIVAAAEPAAPDAKELEPILERILSRDDRNPRALWLSGAVASSAGDAAKARRHWTLLLETLDPNSIQYIELRKQIEALPGG